MYVGFPASTGEQLKGFKKLVLAPGESDAATVELDARVFSVWDAAAHDWVRRPGCYAILVGESSRDLPLKGTVPIAGARCGPTARRGCASRRSVLIHVRGVRHVRVRSLAVYVNGRRQEVRRAGRTAVRVSLSGRPKRLAHVRVVATTRRGRRLVDRRTYRPCTRRVTALSVAWS